ncbi:cytochrome P450 71A6-like [Prunus dulcis]|uniref:cytochrome P450 71A6-like n=1 Tax=Prunus dulcis TaxID=3755 RepID=UPI00148367D1|nr:cytochrome P450 71A6-like [Prunus dulcis]
MTRPLRHPRVLKKVQNEIMGIANSKPDIAEIDLDQMHYLKAVIEALRLYPPIPLLAPRESTKDVKIKGCDIAARTMVLVNAWTIGRDPSLWDEPERVLNSAVDFKGRDFQLIPFVHKFDWALPCGARAEDMNMTEWTGLVIHRQVPPLAVPKLRPF